MMAGGKMLSQSMAIYFSYVFILICNLLSPSNGNYPLLDVDTNMRIVLIPYDTPVGTIIYRLKASDSDNNFPLAFEVLGSVGKSLLGIEFLGCSIAESLCQADVLLNKGLVEGRTYEFKLRVRDTTGDYTQVPAVITATSASFAAHSVIGTKILHVPENTKVGERLGEPFVVLKNDFNARLVTLEMRDKDDRVELKQRLLPNNRTEGILYLKKPLDYETEPWFTFRLLAMNAFTNTNVDTRNVLVSEVIVAVQDVQDTPPEFTILPTYVEIPKSIQEGELITKVAAVDGDKQNKRLIRYGFLTDSNPFVSFFDLEPMTGEIFLKRDLSQLSSMSRPNEPIRMTIIAEEIIPETEHLHSHLTEPNNASTTQAVITFWLGPGVAVGPPRFSSEQFVTEIMEDSVIGTALQFSHEPQIWYDSLDDVVTLTIASPSVHGKINDTQFPFEIVPREGRGNFSFEIRLLNPKLVDYESVQQIKAKLLAASAMGMVTSADLTVHVRDANDHSPVFSQKEYRVDLPEHVPAGTRVVQVHATDRDSGNNGRIVYTSLIGSEAFRLDALTGEITVDRPDLLDREQEQEIRLYVEAKDGGYTDASTSIDGGLTAVRNVASATIVVTIMDVNDNKPRFTEKFYQVILTPDLTALKYPVRITAEDDDAEGPNSIVRYQLTPDSPRQFSIDQMTGELKLRSPFKPDFHNQDGLYLGSLRVRAYDSGNPQMSNEVTVQIFSKEVLSRQIQFVLPSKPDLIENNKKKIEDMLSTITGGSAIIKDVRLLQPSRTQTQSQIQATQTNGGIQPKSQQQQDHDQISTDESASSSALQPNGNQQHGSQQQGQQQQQPPQHAATRHIPSEKSLVTAEVTYPISSAPVVDLDAFQRTYMTTENLSTGTSSGGGVETVNNRTQVTDRQIELFRAENQVLFWLLIAFILLLCLLFAIFLCCIFCPCCYLYSYCKRYDKRRDQSQELNSEKRRNRKTYPSRIEEEAEEYDVREQQQHGYRREAWSGNDGGGGGTFRRGHGGNNEPRRYPQKNIPPQGGRHNGNNRAQGDISIEDWEFNEHGGVRGGDRAEEIGQRWQGQQQQQRGPHDGQRLQYPPAPGMAIMDNLITDGFVSRRPLQNNPPDVDHASEPGNNTYLMQRLNHLPPGARPYNKFYPPPQSPAAHSLPPTEQQIRAQTRPTRFYRTEAGEVLQLDDYDGGDEGKELLMQRFISEQQPQNEQVQQHAPPQQQQPLGPETHEGTAGGEKRRIQTPAAIIVPPNRNNNNVAQTDVKAVQIPGTSSKGPTPANSTTTLAERPKAAVVSRRSREALDFQGPSLLEKSAQTTPKESHPPPAVAAAPVPAKAKSEASKGKHNNHHHHHHHHRRGDSDDEADDGRRRKRERAEKEKSRSRSYDSGQLTPKTTTSSKKSKSKSKSRSKSPMVPKSRHKSARSRSQSHGRSRSRSISPSSHNNKSRKGHGDKEKDRHAKKSQKSKVPKSKQQDREVEDKTAAAVAAAAASVVAKRSSLEQSTLGQDHEALLSSLAAADGSSSQLTAPEQARTTNISISISPSSAKTEGNNNNNSNSNNYGGTSIQPGQPEGMQSYVDTGGGGGGAGSSSMNNSGGVGGTTIANNINVQNTMIHEQYYDSQLLQEEDGDSGIGIVSNPRNRMLEKKSVFTIAYDEMASQKVLRPDTAMRPSTVEAL